MSLARRGRNAVAAAMVVSIPLIAYIDAVTGRDFSLSAFYLIPIAVIAWIWGPIAGIAAAMASAVAGYVTDEILLVLWRPKAWIVIFDECVRAAIFISFAALAASARQALLQARARERERARANDELRAFNYAVAHHLRAPVRAMRAAAFGLPRDASMRILNSAMRMEDMIEGLLAMARIGEIDLRRDEVNLSALALEAALESTRRAVGARPAILIEPDILAQGDGDLLRLLLRTLLDNAWKFASRAPCPRIEFGVRRGKPAVYFVRDNGVGFDMRHADKLFQPFQRLHGRGEFPGVGVGLVVAERIVHRYGGRIWAVGEIGQGACFYFTLDAESGDDAG